MASVRISGLFRCCVMTALKAPEGKEGDKLECEHCDEEMIYHNGSFEYQQPQRLKDFISKRMKIS
jgi:hypothetical protein